MNLHTFLGERLRSSYSRTAQNAMTFRFAIMVTEAVVGRVRESAKERNETNGDQTELGGAMRREGGTTGCGLHLLSMTETCHALQAPICRIHRTWVWQVVKTIRGQDNDCLARNKRDV
jgi:hypothetical protein